ncbi:MAG: tRNA (adenosine(37)-N6)-threonylcarbamoyltransferase complex dimerization subunit type 1 TsaB, partial [Cucumibacter sp.]
MADGRTLSIAEDRARGHAEVLIGQVDLLLARGGIAHADIDRVAVTTGPGSFTGLRVGLAAARGFGLALSIPVLGVGTLTALSLAARAAAPLCVLVDARRGEAWRQFFSAPGVPVSPPEILYLKTALAGLGPGARILGSASALAADRAGSTDLELLRPERDRG